MRNLLGRLHARRLPELLRIADAWSVPLQVESKSEVVGALYRAMSDPRAMRDLWDRLEPPERALTVALAEAADSDAAPTIADLAARLGAAESETRETALRLYRAGILAREGDDEPLPIGAAPRLILPRELAQGIRRVQDEMAAGDLTRSPLRVLIELLDDAELEMAARGWGLRTVPGVARRRDLGVRLLRLVNDPARVERVVRSRGRDAASVWGVVGAAAEPMPLVDVARAAGLADANKVTRARLRAALAELESALLVWHAYRGDGSRWLFVPPEIRTPGEAPATVLSPLVDAAIAAETRLPWHHPDAVAWDLLTLLRIVVDPQAPLWEAADPPPRWLQRVSGQRLWFRERDGPPAGYLELLLALGRAEGVLAVDETTRPHRVVAGPHARAWRGRAFTAQTTRLRERWLRLQRWLEGEAAGVVEVWGADWRGLRPRLLAALADPEVGLEPGRWVTIESLAQRIVTRYPMLLGASFTAATARQGGEIGAGVDEDEARAAAMADVVALELAGPFVWFGLTEIADAPGQPRAVGLTAIGAALAARKPLPAEERSDPAGPPLEVDPSGEITLRTPSPDRVWALSTFAEPVDLGAQSHYRLTQGSIGGALAAGIERDQIVGFLERGARQALPEALSANLAEWARGARRVRLRRAVVLRVDDAAERQALLQALRDGAWIAEPLGDLAVLVSLGSDATSPARGEDALLAALRAAGHAPRWAVTPDDDATLAVRPAAPAGQVSLPGGDGLG